MKQNITKREILTISISVAIIVVLITTFLLLTFLLFLQPSYEVSLGDVKNGKILFEDNFDGDKVDESKWNIMGKDAPSPRRGGYWSGDQVSIYKSNLIIKTSKVGDKYYTGCVDTNGKADLKYGYFETRCILPRAYGLWSAFWLMSNKFGGSENPKDASVNGAEIDIFESPYCNDPAVQQAVHNGGYGSHHSSIFNPNFWNNKIAPDPFNEYHTYGLYWDENIYKFYIDDQCVWTTNFYENVSKIAEHMILSVEIGGNNTIPDKDWCEGIITQSENDVWFNTPGRTDFVIDYVRVYEVGSVAVAE